MRSEQDRRHEGAWLLRFANRGHTVFGHTALEALALVLATTAHRRISLAELTLKLGCRQTAVDVKIRRLVAQGLLSREPGTARTLRATCRWIPASRLGQEPRKEG